MIDKYGQSLTPTCGQIMWEKINDEEDFPTFTGVYTQQFSEWNNMQKRLERLIMQQVSAITRETSWRQIENQ